jgi:predicted acyltransferase (DUF342 family)
VEEKMNDDPKYLIDLEQKLPDLEVLRLRSEVAALKKQLDEANKVLEENDLAESKPKAISSEEKICIEQIELLSQLSAKGMPFQMEDTKQLEILVKTLLAIRGKAPVVEENSKKKKKEPTKVADLLAIVKANPKVNE